MTPQEQQMLQSLTDRINQTVITDKDPEAERYLQDTLGRNPDALYILAQTTLVQEYALKQAQQQLADLKAQQQAPPPPPPPQKHTSFLGSLLGQHDDAIPLPPYQPVQPQQTQYAPPQYAQPQYAQPQYIQQPGFGSSFGQIPGQGGGFLSSALRTATGVAAGALAFEGIEDLMHGFGGHSGYGQNFGGGFGGGGRPEEIINNNYYGDSDRSHANFSPDVEDRRDDFSSRLQNADSTSGSNDAPYDPINPDDNDSDPSTSDDTSAQDDSSSYDPVSDFSSNDNS